MTKRPGIIGWLRGLLKGTSVNAAAEMTDSRIWSAMSYFAGGAETKAGVVVNELNAMTYSAVYAATRVICGTGGSLPLHLYRSTDVEVDGKPRESRERARGHQLGRVLGIKANPYMTAGNFRRIMWQWQLNWGNAVALKVVDQTTGQVDSLWPIHPSRLTPVDGDGFTIWRYRKPDSGTQDFYPQDVFHVPNILTSNGTLGIGTIQMARESIGMGLATEKYGATFFNEGGVPRIVVSHPGPPMEGNVRAQFVDEFQQTYRKGGGVALLAGGAKADHIGLSAEDSQFLQTREHNIEDISRWYPVSDFTGNKVSNPPTAPATEASGENPSVRAAVQKMLVSAMGRMAVKEAKAVERAAAKPDAFLAVVDEFYAKHQEQLAEAIAAPLEVIGLDPNLVAAGWCGDSRSELLDVAGNATAQDLSLKVQSTVGDWKTRRVEATLKDLLT